MRRSRPGEGRSDGRCTPDSGADCPAAPGKEHGCTAGRGSRRGRGCKLPGRSQSWSSHRCGLATGILGSLPRGSIILIDTSGQTVAKLGDTVVLGGGYVSPSAAHASSCTGSETVFAASSLRLLSL